LTTFQHPRSFTIERPQAVVGISSSGVSSRSDHNNSNNGSEKKAVHAYLEGRDSAIPDAEVEARDRADKVQTKSRTISSTTGGTIDGNINRIRGAVNHPIGVNRVDFRGHSFGVSYDISIHSHTRKWDPHPFPTDPPFLLWSQGESGPYYPRMIVVQNNPLSRFLGVGVLAIEDVYPKIYRAMVSIPKACSLLSWFRGFQKLNLGENISLLDP